MCCATRWPWTVWIIAACISERRADRCTARRTPGIAGIRLCATCRRSFRSRCKRCHDPGRAALPPETAGERRERGSGGSTGPSDAAVGAERPGSPVPDAVRDDTGPCHAAAAAILTLLRVPGRSVARVAGRTAAGGCSHGEGASVDRGGHRRRLVPGGENFTLPLRHALNPSRRTAPYHAALHEGFPLQAEGYRYLDGIV